MFRNNLWLLVKETGLALAIGIGVWTLLAVPCSLYFSILASGYLTNGRGGISGN